MQRATSTITRTASGDTLAQMSRQRTPGAVQRHGARTLGHEGVLTTLFAHGTVPEGRQREITDRLLARLRGDNV